MFRFTIRETLLVTVIVALATAWWLDRTSLLAAKAEAVEDARDLAFWTTPGMMHCGNTAYALIKLREKYGARAFVGSDVDPYEHSLLGVDISSR